MSKESVEIVIDDHGSVQVSVEGVAGKGCSELTKDLEEALGGAKKKTFTSDYKKQPKNKQGEKQRAI